MADMYRDRVQGTTLAARMDSLKRLFGERRVPLDIDGDTANGPGTELPGVVGNGTHQRASAGTHALPMLTVAECPYPELAEKDRGICAVEKMLFAKLLEQPMRLTQCRLDGHSCCQFQTN